MTRPEAQRCIGQRVHVHAPGCYLHGEIVDVFDFSPRQPDVLRTSAGPLDWTRPDLELTALPRSQPVL